MRRILPLLLLCACQFDLTRDLGPGELRGRLIYEDAGGTRTAAASALVSVDGTGVKVKADADGKFVVRGLPAGTYGLRVEHDVDGLPGFDAGLRLRALILQAGPTGEGLGRDLGDLTIGGLGGVKGRLLRGGVAEDGRVVVGLVREGPTTAGAFELASILPGQYDLGGLDSTGKLALRVVDVAPRAFTEQDLDFGTDAVALGSVAGRVRLAGQTSHGGVKVTVDLDGSTAESNGDGGFVFASLRGGVYTVLFEKEGYRPLQVARVLVGEETILDDFLMIPLDSTCELGGNPASVTDRDADGTADATEPAACVCASGTTDTDDDALCDDADRDLNGNGIDDALESNHPPSIDGAQQLHTLVGRQVKLGLRAVDPDEDLLTWQWSLISGPAATLDDATSATPTFVARRAGTYVFKLVVSDGRAEAEGEARITVHDIDGGESHSVALKADGTLLAWGYNGEGSLGNGTLVDAASPRPVCAPGATDCVAAPFTGVVAIASGRAHTLALKADGTVWSWGSNGYGELGDGSSDARTTPVPVCASDANPDCAAAPMTDVIAIAAGYRHSVALKADGTVWSWGYNRDGQLANASLEYSRPFAVPACKPGTSTEVALCAVDDENVLTRVVRIIAGGGGHTLAIDDAGAVWAWGHNKNAQTGNGDWTVEQVRVPSRVCAPGASSPCTDFLSHVVDFDAWSGHSVVVDDSGAAWAFGSNNDGELGAVTSATCYGGAACSQVPVAICASGDSPCTTPLTNVASVVAGRRFSMALLSDGSVRAWGDNAFNELGDGTLVNRGIPGPVCAVGGTAPCPTGLTNIAALAAGSFHAFALTKDGALVGWGHNGNGQLGLGHLDPVGVPTVVPGY